MLVCVSVVLAGCGVWVNEDTNCDWSGTVLNDIYACSDLTSMPKDTIFQLFSHTGAADGYLCANYQDSDIDSLMMEGVGTGRRGYMYQRYESVY